MIRRFFLPLLFFSNMLQAETVFHALRLKPSQDVRKEIEAFVVKEKIRAGSIVSAVGSVKEVSLRFANKSESSLIKGPLEVVTLSGTIGQEGSHLHMAVADGEGRTLGGHLTEGSKVFTTLEVVIAVYSDLLFTRALDKSTGYKELEIQRAK